MTLEDESPAMPASAGLPTTRRGETSSSSPKPGRVDGGHEDERSGSDLMERVVSRANLMAALKRVKANKGSAGVDGMTTEELRAHLMTTWPRLREDLLFGRYRPQLVKRVAIPKSGGGMRELGIPTVVDRFIQQALLQVLQPMFDPTFSNSSYGFRPTRSAHQAVLVAQRYVQEGRGIVVDVDLEKFFDRVNHDVLMGRLEKRLDDKRVLVLIRRFLEAGVMVHGVVMERHEGTPQGGPLSPLLANFLLDEVDKELERRGHAFVRYADDCNVYVRSQRAGERVLDVLRGLFGRLRLRINEEKSAVAPATSRKFLGFSLWTRKGQVHRRVADKAMATMKDRVRQLTRRTAGKSLEDVVDELGEYLRGWKGYFRLAETPRVFDDIDGWIRHRLRALKLKQWHRGTTAYPEALAMGASPNAAARIAGNLRSYWRNARMLANTIMPNRFFDELGLPRLGR
jgi:group II intron reverse transcriptase/maturase